MKSLKILLCALLLAVCLPSAASVQITIVNNDGPNEGFNDPTPFTPTGGNPAQTVGDARMIAFQFAANLWGSSLDGNVEVLVEGQWDPLPCTATSGTLGAAGPVTVHGNFANAPNLNTWYPAALAGSLSGSDPSPGNPDISATFNSDLGTPGCLTTSGWYYGLDGNPPAGQFDFVSILLHELGHGLGFLSLVDLNTGQKLSGFDDTYILNLMDTTITPSQWPNMTNAQRLTSITNDPNVFWTGPSVFAANGNSNIRMHAPNPAQPGSSISHFSNSVTPDELMEPFYVAANHDLGLALNLMEDIGWVLDTSNGVDVVFMMDVTGSTGALLPDWVAQIPIVAQSWLDFDANARFAIVSHVDFPFSPHGATGEWPYRVEADFTNAGDPPATTIASLTATLGGMTNMWGYDAPESQYEALYQVLTGAGLLLSTANYTGPGEIQPGGLTKQNPMVLYHFTWPEQFHNPDTDPNYPTAAYNSSVNGENAVLAELAAQGSNNMFFGLTYISGTPKRGLFDYEMDPLLGNEAIDPLQVTEYPINVRKRTTGPLVDMANTQGGSVFDLISGLSGLQTAIDDSIEIWGGSRQGGDEYDRDGIPNELDPCPYDFGPKAFDYDRDKVGDVCDNCPRTYNPDQADENKNGIGDACEPVIKVRDFIAIDTRGRESVKISWTDVDEGSYHPKGEIAYYELSKDTFTPKDRGEGVLHFSIITHTGIPMTATVPYVVY